MVPAGAPTQGTVDELAALHGRRRHDHRRRQLEVDRRQAARGGARAAGPRLRRRRHERRRLGPRGGLLHDGRRSRRRRSQRLAPILDVLAPETNQLSRQAIGPRGWGHFGPSGAGHYVKMVHNGIEYGLMQAYAEGFDLFDKSEYELDNAKIAHLWNQGSVVRSWLCELAARAFEHGGQRPRRAQPATPPTPARGAGRSRTRCDKDVPTPVITASLLRALLQPRQRRLHAPHAGRAARAVRRPRDEEGDGRVSTRRPAEPQPPDEGARAPAGAPDGARDLRRDRRPRAAQAVAGALQPRPRGRAARALRARRQRALGALRRGVPRARGRRRQRVLAPDARREGARQALRARALRRRVRSTTTRSTRA